MRSARFLEEIEFAGKENIRGVVFNEERVIHNRQVFVCTIAQEIELVINNNVIPNIIQEQEKVKKKRKKQRENM